jgi:hypothetical protein
MANLTTTTNNEHRNAATGTTVASGQTVTESFGSTAIQRSAETSATAAAATARAMVEARFVLALKAPRDMDAVRLRVLKECKRPGFADVARYSKPIGGGKTADGASIRFVEAAIRCMGNMLVETRTLFDDDKIRKVAVVVIELESNTSYEAEVTVTKTVERSKVPNGVQAISSRTNSNGYTTYLLPATDDDLLNKQNSLISKAIRTLGLRILPGDIVDEAQQLVIKVQRDRDAQDPSAARLRLIDSFAELGVKPADLKAFVGHDLDTLSPVELTRLRGVYTAVRDGETSWKEVLASTTTKAADGAPAPAGGLKERAAAKVGKKVGETPAPAPVAPPPAAAAAPSPAPSGTQPREPGDDTDDVDPEEADRRAAEAIDRGL